MSRFFKTSLYIYIVFLHGALFGQISQQVTIKPGLLYQTWTPHIEPMTCALSFETPPITNAKRLPAYVIMVIDASNSMEGTILNEVKNSIKTVIRSLTDSDIFSLITYANTSEVLFPLQPLNQNNRKSAENAISRITNETNNNLSDALNKVSEQLNRFKGQQNSGQFIILITNSSPNKGQTDKTQLTLMVKKIAETYDARFSTIGYDKKFDEDLLISFAQQSGGRAYFIEYEQLSTLNQIASSEAQRILSIFSKNVTCEMTLPTPTTVINTSNGTIINSNKLLFHDLPANKQFILFFDISQRPIKSKDGIISIEYFDPFRQTIKHERLFLTLPVDSVQPQYDSKVGPQIVEYLILKKIAQDLSEIEHLNGQKRYEYAQVLKQTILKLTQDNGRLQSTYLTKVCENLTRFQTNCSNSAIENEVLIKQIKYLLYQLTYERQQVNK